MAPEISTKMVVPRIMLQAILASIPYVSSYPLIELSYGLVISASAAFWFESFHAWKSAP
jgi:hypothetical protein